MDFEHIFRRIDEETLKKYFLSETCFELLIKINPELQQAPDKLRSLVLEILSPLDIISNRRMRKELFNSLRYDDASKLAQLLHVKINETDYTKLCNININKNRKKLILEFFDTDYIEPVENIPSSVETIEPIMPLFDYQRKIVIEATDAISIDPNRVLIHMPTGSGKTRVAMRIIVSELLTNEPSLIIWLANNVELAEQAIDGFKNLWAAGGNRNIEIIRFFESHDVDPTFKNHNMKDALLVATFKKLDEIAKNDTFLSKLSQRTSLVVVDEAHQIVADTYSFVSRQLSDRYGVKLIGLSATPGRSTTNIDEDKELAKFFHKKKVTISQSDPINYLIENKYLSDIESKLVKFDGDTVITEDELAKISTLSNIPESVLIKLGNDVQRSIRIIAEVQELINEGHKRIIVFTPTADNARDITLALLSRKIISRYIVSGTQYTSRKNIIDFYRSNDPNPIILCNFGVLTTGFDAPKTTAIIIARPTKSLVLYHQMVGRVMRGPKAGGSLHSKVITFIDKNLVYVEDMSDSFKTWNDVW